ncbi:MAG: GAF domain-containing protein [Nitrospiraceae bacterium]|nr:GAF domain-containing protein [Nitrospiraceae bacterium]
MIASIPDEGTLCDGICRILIEDCGLSHALVGVPDPQGWVKILSANGKMHERLKNVRISVEPGRPEGRGIFSRAYRNATPFIENHLLDLPEMRIWRPLLRDMASGSIAVFPFFRAGTVQGSPDGRSGPLSERLDWES